MPKKFKLKNGTEIIVNDTPFASGGEGDLFDIIKPSNYGNQVVKLYKPEKQTKERENKIEYLISNPPKINIQDGHHSIIWANQIIYDGNKFVGFIMHKAKGEKLEYLCHPKMPQNLGINWRKYDFQNPEALAIRKKLCFNIAVAIFQIHTLGNYVLVDMKPENIMVQPNGLISIIDIDSVEVIQNNKVLFAAPVATPEFIPPEYYKGLKPEKDVIPETWDRFSLSVIFYRLFCGIHPFIGTCKSPYENINEASGKIELGLFPNGKNSNKFRIIPPPHNNVKKLDKTIQDLFISCFDDGHTSPSLRPSADDWCRVFAPKPVIKINRHLPSSIYKIDAFTIAMPSEFTWNYSAQYNNPLLLNLNEPKGIGVFLSNIFGVSRKNRLIEEIIKKERHWQEVNKGAKAIIDALDNVKTNFQKYQQAKIKDEIENIENIKSQYQKALSLIDIEAETLFRKEYNMLETLEQETLHKLSTYDAKIKQLHGIQIQPVEQKYTSSLNNLQQQNTSLIEQEAKEVKKLELELMRKINDIKREIQKIETDFISQHDLALNQQLQEISKKRNDLKFRRDKTLATALEIYQGNFLNTQSSQYDINTDARSIFNDQYADLSRIVRNLASYGINTAADFSAVNADGEILTASGKWVKVPQVGGYRADCLEAWRRTKSRNAPTTVPQLLPQSETDNIKKQYDIEYIKLEQEERTARNEALNKKANVPSLFINQKIEVDKKEQGCSSHLM
jgi:serine/threonine protein kinase